MFATASVVVFAVSVDAMRSWGVGKSPPATTATACSPGPHDGHCTDCGLKCSAGGVTDADTDGVAVGLGLDVRLGVARNDGDTDGAGVRDAVVVLDLVGLAVPVSECVKVNDAVEEGVRLAVAVTVTVALDE